MNFYSFIAQAETALAPKQNFAEKASTYIQDHGPALLQKLVFAVLIFIIGKFIARMISNIAVKVMEKSKVDETLRQFLSTIIYAILMVLVIISVLNKLGVDTTSFAAVLAACGLAIGLALQGSLSNFASGVMIVLFKPYKVGDFVKMAGTAGVVKEVHIFNTILTTPDNRVIIVPNGNVTGGNIENVSANPTRRIDLVFSCAYSDDVKAVKDYLEAVIKSSDKVLAEPEAAVAVAELADSSINFNFRPWVKSEDYWAVRSYFLETVKNGFDEKGFTIPYPTQELNLVQNDK